GLALVARRVRTRLVRTAVLALRLLRPAPYAYDDVYYGIYGPYAYYDPGVNGRGVSSGRYGGRSRRYAATTNGPRPRAAEVCSNQSPELTDWPIERISEVVQPTDAQRLDELRAASAKAIEILQSGCPKDLP